MSLNEIAFALVEIKKHMDNPDLLIESIDLEEQTITFESAAHPTYSLRTWERIR